MIYDLGLTIGSSHPERSIEPEIINHKCHAFLPQQLQERFRKPLFVGASPTGGPNLG